MMDERDSLANDIIEKDERKVKKYFDPDGDDDRKLAAKDTGGNKEFVNHLLNSDAEVLDQTLYENVLKNKDPKEKDTFVESIKSQLDKYQKENKKLEEQAKGLRKKINIL